MDDIDVGVVDEVTVIVIGFQFLTQLCLAEGKCFLKVGIVDITHRHKATSVIAGEVITAAANATNTDDAFGELVARGDVFGTAEHVARHDSKQ